MLEDTNSLDAAHVMNKINDLIRRFSHWIGVNDSIDVYDAYAQDLECISYQFLNIFIINATINPAVAKHPKY